MASYGIEALVRILLHLLFIYLTFTALQSLKLETTFKKGHDRQIQLFYILLSIAVGYTTSSFFLECMTLIKGFVSTVFTN